MSTGAFMSGDSRQKVAVVDPRTLVRSAVVEALERLGVDVLGAGPDLADVGPLAPEVLLVTPATERCHTLQVSAEGVDVADLAAWTLLLTRPSSAQPEAPVGRPLLTELEIASLEAAASGLSAAEVARARGTSARSVENARGRARAKLGAVSTAEAVHRYRAMEPTGPSADRVV